MAEQEMEVEDYSLKKERKKKRKRKPIDLTIEMVKENPEKIAPLVGYFPTGYDPHNKVQDDDNGDDVKVYRHNRGTRLELVVKPKGSKVNFVGTSYSGEGKAPIACQYALGILDKETRTLKIVKIESNKIFRLEPKFAGKDEVLEESKLEPLTVKEKYEGTRDLTDAFGTKSARKRLREVANLNKKEDEETKRETAKKIKEAMGNTDATACDDSQPARNIPHHDIMAETPEKAYPIDKMISKRESDALKNVLEGKLSPEGRLSPNVYPIFVCNRVQKLKEIKDETERQTLGVILLYMTHLIKFKDQQTIDHRASAKSHRIPEILDKKFRSMFLDEDDGGKKNRGASGPKNDLLISCVLVLSLIVDGFDSDQTDIAQDLRLTTLKLRPYYLNLGCKMVGGGRGKIPHATLPVPLKFPPQERRQRSKTRY